MALDSKQRNALVTERGEPALRLEFDMFGDGHISMWTHFQHSSDFMKVKSQLVAIRDHLSEFIDDEGMCPFHTHVHRVAETVPGEAKRKPKLVQDFHREAEERLDEIERREADHSEHEGEQNETS